ncbi:MAG TPA: DNA-processing protein DprA [Bacilli bacterium]|nr:DNA-processing protein DprA [Bacilli bacterium]
MFTAREVLLYFALKFEGDYDAILNAIKNKVAIDESDYQFLITSFKGQYMTIVDMDYPDEFKKIYRPPLVIFYKGDQGLLSNLAKAIVVIGTRNPSQYGLKMATILSTELAKEKFIIVSGMAKGIDAVAHECALRQKGKTIAVLGSGIDNPYPRENKDLYQRLVAEGLVISEYPGLTRPNKNNFPERNRLVASLGRAVLVIEARTRSGTLITVGASLASGGDIYCVPSLADSDSGTNRLIKDGAYLVETIEDIKNLWRN